MKSRDALSAASALVIASTAHASMIGPVLTIQASSRAGTATLTIDQSALQQVARDDGGMEWTLAHPVELLGNYGATVATLSDASFLVVGGQTIGMSFATMGGPMLTTIQITSSLLSFPTIDPAEGTASAGISLTDVDGDGASIFSEFMLPGVFQARYNGGSVFAGLVPNFSTGPYETATSDQGTGAFTPIGAVSDMQTEFHFSVTANDKVAGTSVFVVQPQVPAPGAAVLAFAAIGVATRRRRA